MAITGSNRKLKGTDLDPSLNARCPGHLKEHSHGAYRCGQNQRERKQPTPQWPPQNQLGDECPLIQLSFPTPSKTRGIFFQGEKTRYREVSSLTQGHTASTQRSLYLNLLWSNFRAQVLNPELLYSSAGRTNEKDESGSHCVYKGIVSIKPSVYGSRRNPSSITLHIPSGTKVRRQTHSMLHSPLLSSQGAIACEDPGDPVSKGLAVPAT